MTLHTRVVVTTPDVDMRETFDRMRELIGATDEYTWFESPELDSDNEWRRTMKPGFHMDVGQGLPALMWVEQGTGEAEGHDPEWCEDDCDGAYHDPAHWVEINFDTGYAYCADNGASCSDLHAWLVQEIGAWLTDQGAEWQWYDESGEGWNHGPGWGTLGDPEIGRLGSTVRKQGRDEKRDFGMLAMAAVAAGIAGESS